MPGYIKKQLLKYKYAVRCIKHCPYSPEPGADTQSPSPLMTCRNSPRTKLKKVQKIVGSILYYAGAVDLRLLMALSTVASELRKGAENTMEKDYQVLDYLATYLDATVHFWASNMVMNIQSDVSYLTEPKARSHACSHFFMGSLPQDGKPIKINGAFHTLCSILQFVVASTTEAELGVLFLNRQEGMIFQLTLENLGHPQPKILVHCDNATAIGIANNTIKRQRSRAMEMRYFWVGDKVSQDIYSLSCHPGQDDLGNYQSKHHPGAHHTAVGPYYLNKKKSLLELPRAVRLAL
jgi:hypothetical protein